jgi:methylmalonyl-CoA mutase cobalamin-binding subunit
MLSRVKIFPEGDLPSGAELLAEGAALAKTWSIGPSPFLAEMGVASETEYKLRRIAEKAVMQHAQIGYRDCEKSRRAYGSIWEECSRKGVRVDRYGLCLDWSMALPRAVRASATRGTGMILPGIEDFVSLTDAAPAAPHFGDFVLGFPAALENTQAALAAGSTAIGNLGQYFTFRIPGWDDDIEATRATVLALGLIAGQPVPVIVHSNLDDGFAAQFTDLASCLGMAIIEKSVITDLVGAPMGHCFGHHFSDPLTRFAFHRAMSMIDSGPGTMLYGNTTSYRGTPAANYASLASYLLVDVVGQQLFPTGHAVNPVPVTENERIPEIDEVVDAQLFAGTLVNHGRLYEPLIDVPELDRVAAILVEGGKRFAANVTQGLANAGVDLTDAFEMLLALRRLGARYLEREYGVGEKDGRGARAPVVPATILTEIHEMARSALSHVTVPQRDVLRRTRHRVLVATSDVHEHGKMLIEEMLKQLDVESVDGGVSTDPDRVAALVEETGATAIAISTYNGVALSYCLKLQRELEARGLRTPILIGGRLNQIPEASNSSLPVDVGDQLREAGAMVCRDASDLVQSLLKLAHLRQSQTKHGARR